MHADGIGGSDHTGGHSGHDDDAIAILSHVHFAQEMINLTHHIVCVENVGNREGFNTPRQGELVANIRLRCEAQQRQARAQARDTARRLAGLREHHDVLHTEGSHRSPQPRG